MVSPGDINGPSSPAVFKNCTRIWGEKNLEVCFFSAGGEKHTKPTKPKKTVILSWPLGVASDLRDWLVKAYTVWSFP